MRRFFCMCYNTAMLEIKDVTKIYPNGVKALDHLNLSIPKGKRTVLLGPSGCGKTTLLRIIAGLEDCTQGTIDRDGLSKISFVFQDDKLLERISVYDNIAYGIDLRTTSKEELKAMKKIKQVIMNSPVLIAIDYKSKWAVILQVNSSVIGVGWILRQEHKNGKRKVNCFRSIN